MVGIGRRDPTIVHVRWCMAIVLGTAEIGATGHVTTDLRCHRIVPATAGPATANLVARRAVVLITDAQGVGSRGTDLVDRSQETAREGRSREIVQVDSNREIGREVVHRGVVQGISQGTVL